MIDQIAYFITAIGCLIVGFMAGLNAPRKPEETSSDEEILD